MLGPTRKKLGYGKDKVLVMWNSPFSERVLNLSNCIRMKKLDIFRNTGDIVLDLQTEMSRIPQGKAPGT